MSTVKPHTASGSRDARSSRRSLLLAPAFVAVVGGAWSAGCSHDWDAYDPRLAGSGGTAASGGTGGAATSTGGTATSTGGTATSTGGTGAADPSGGAGGTVTSTGGGGAGGTTSSTSSAGGTGGEGGAGGDGGAGGEGGGPTRCGGTSALAEDFSGGPLDLWDGDEWGGAVLSQSGGELVVSLPSNSASGSEAYLITDYYYDLRQDAVSVEVTSATDTSSSAWAYFVVGPSDDDNVEIYQEEGTLHFEREIADLDTSLKTMPYDPVAHRHWRIREDGLDVSFETSPDGVSWTVQAQTPTADLFPLDYVRVVLGGGASSGQASPGEARFDHLNGGGAPKQKYCPVSSITDDFEDGDENIRWAHAWEDTPGMLTEASGHLVVQYVPDATDFAALVSASAFDLTNSSIVLEVPVAPDPSSETAVFLELNGPGEDSPSDNDVEMHLSEGQLEFGIVNAGQYQELGSVLHSPVQHRWWRIREASNTLYWETAPDGKAWTTQLSLSPVPVPIDVLEVEIGGGTYGSQPSPGASHFDNVNLPPP